MQIKSWGCFATIMQTALRFYWVVMYGRRIVTKVLFGKHHSVNLCNLWLFHYVIIIADITCEVLFITNNEAL